MQIQIFPIVVHDDFEEKWNPLKALRASLKLALGIFIVGMLPAFVFAGKDGSNRPPMSGGQAVSPTAASTARPNWGNPFSGLVPTLNQTPSYLQRPFDLNALIVDSSLVLSWSPALTGPFQNPDGYRILRSNFPGAPAEILGSVYSGSGADNSFQQSLLAMTPGSWCYQVVAFRQNPPSQSELSEPACVEIPWPLWGVTKFFPVGGA